MLDRNNKISVLHKMIRDHSGDAASSNYVVPQNSLTTFSQKCGLSEVQLQQQSPPVENSVRSKKAPQTGCQNCENMAKNFLYLESMIRTNYNANAPCNVCHSSLQYLQNVNKNNIKSFGNFDSVAMASKYFVPRQRGILRKSHNTTVKLLASSSKSLSRKNNMNNKKVTLNSTTTKGTPKTLKSKSRVSNSTLRKLPSNRIKNKKKSSTENQQKQEKSFKKKLIRKPALKKSKEQK